MFVRSAFSLHVLTNVFAEWDRLVDSGLDRRRRGRPTPGCLQLLVSMSRGLTMWAWLLMTIKQILMGTTQVCSQPLTETWCSLRENVATPSQIEPLSVNIPRCAAFRRNLGSTPEMISLAAWLNEPIAQLCFVRPAASRSKWRRRIGRVRRR